MKKLSHVLDEEYQITHILASLLREYSSVVEQAKIDRRTGSTLITMDEIKKRLKEHYLQLKREHGWSEDEMVLNMKSSSNQSNNIKKGNKGRFLTGFYPSPKSFWSCTHVNICQKYKLYINLHTLLNIYAMRLQITKHQENPSSPLKITRIDQKNQNPLCLVIT